MTDRRLPSLTGLRAFEAFARRGSMTRAAEELCVTHGAVSRQIKALEATLGARLVAGPRHRLTLTSAGRLLAASLGAAFDLIAAGLPGAENAEELVVSCLGTLAMKWLIPRLPAFLDANPGVRVRIVESNAPVDFGQGGLHAAIRIGQGRAQPGLRSLVFMPQHLGPVLSPALFHELAGRRDRLFNLPRLHSETHPPAWDDWARLAGVDLSPASLDRVFQRNSYMLEAAAAGLGIAVAPWAFAQADIERGRLVAPWGFERETAEFVYLRPAAVENRMAERFGAWLREQGRASPTAPPTAPAASAASSGSGR